MKHYSNSKATLKEPQITFKEIFNEMSDQSQYATKKPKLRIQLTPEEDKIVNGNSGEEQMKNDDPYDPTSLEAISTNFTDLNQWQPGRGLSKPPSKNKDFKVNELHPMNEEMKTKEKKQINESVRKLIEETVVKTIGKVIKEKAEASNSSIDKESVSEEED